MMLNTSVITSRKFFKRYKQYVRTDRFAKIYLKLSVAILLLSSALWSTLGATIHRVNADQIVNTQLFESFSTFNNALLPGAHSFLLKWPIFLLAHLFGGTSAVLIAFTVLAVLSTVGILAYILYRIDSRPLMFGTLCLALASTLLMVPAQPYSAALLPVNMAMLATRNLEYVLYLACLIGLIKDRSIYSRGFWLAVLGMSVLIASDKLFLMLSVGGSLVALVVYARNHQWRLTSLSIDWMVLGLISAVFANIIVAAINKLNLTNIVNQSSGSPYAFVTSIHDILLGVIYGFSSILTNFGANPAYDAMTIKSVPHQVYNHLISIGGVTYIINLVIFGFGVFASYQLIKSSLNHRKAASLLKRSSVSLSIMLVSTTIAAFMSYVLTSHYYAADARYLTIAVFTIYIALGTYLSKKRFNAEYTVLAGIGITIGLVLGSTVLINSFTDSTEALTPISERSSRIAQILDNKRVDVLVGDYWRVVPAKLNSNNTLNVMPLGNCTEPRQVLSSKSWQPDLQDKSFAYLLTLDGGNLTDFPHCTLKDVISAYGNPNSSILVAGNLKHPQEYLLFYDKGINNKQTNANSSPALTPITLDQLPNTSCMGPSSLNIVAHQDDDLLFMNPDILKSIKAGNCARTVFVTAGDSGSGKFYYLSRQRGAEAAYSKMLGVNDVWIERVVKLPSQQYITIASPKNISKVSLIFMNLPDGNLQGDGFESSEFASLSKLKRNEMDTLYSLDGQSSYKQEQLVDTLVLLMQVYQPSLIRTQAIDVGYNYHDHSDHTAVGNYTKLAYRQFLKAQYSDQVSIPIAYYIGYATHEFEPNVADQDLADKQAAFLEYAKYDGSVCSTIEQCNNTFTYGAYLTRQYQNNE